MLNTPVLFLVFNRPDTTRQVFEAIRQAMPKQLFVAADGPRPDKEGEQERCDEVRKIATEVDWDCELKTLFRNGNMGCGQGIRNSIDWFFSNVEQGIILEDDCLIQNSFFKFCETLLLKFREEPKISSISGTNILKKWPSQYSYIYSYYGGNWGWATWRRSWILNKDLINQEKLSDSQRYSFLKNIFNSKSQIIAISNLFDEVLIDEKSNEHIWDIQWFYTRLYYQTLSIVPTKNLVHNIGFGKNGTHTMGENPFSTKIYSLNFPLLDNPLRVADRKFDLANGKKYGWIKNTNKIENLFKKLEAKVKSYIKNAF